MSRYREWLVSGRANRLAMAQNWCNIMNEDGTDSKGAKVKKYLLWQIPFEVFTDLMLLFDKARAAYQTANNKETRTSVTIAACDEAFKALVSHMRYIKRHWLISPPLTRVEMESLGLKVNDSSRTAQTAPEERPGMEVTPEGRGAHRVTAINPLTQTKKRPDSAAGVAFARKMRRQDEPVSRAEDMPSEYQTGTSRVYQYTEADYGKVADYATAYENAGGKRGPWSNVTSVIISG